MLVTLVMVFLSLAAGGCAGTGGVAQADSASMTLVYLKTGPNSASHTAAQKQEIFRGHMANMQRLADEGRLVVAGPFVRPRDKAWRGVFIFDAATAEEAERIAATDPGVSSGEFALEIRPIRVAAALREAGRVEKEFQAELASRGGAERKPGEPPPGLRRYVMVHTEDAERTRRALRSPGASGVPAAVLWARFRGGPGGVIVLDAEDPEEAASALALINPGPIGVDGWFSGVSLTRLPAEVRK